MDFQLLEDSQIGEPVWMFQVICCRIKVQLYNKNFCFSTVYMNDAILVWLSVPEAKEKVFILGGPHTPLSIIYLSDPSEVTEVLNMCLTG